MVDKIFGHDVIVIKNQIKALYMNLWSWFVSVLVGIGFTFLQPVYTLPPEGSNIAISIQGPGGMDQLKIEEISEKRTHPSHMTTSLTRLSFSSISITSASTTQMSASGGGFMSLRCVSSGFLLYQGSISLERSYGRVTMPLKT
jgi:hypothetical protein